jgi:sterol desaturase/sphingolipid hydroxylase (fatty acid hydroxylase superfamily)
MLTHTIHIFLHEMTIKGRRVSLELNQVSKSVFYCFSTSCIAGMLMYVETFWKLKVNYNFGLQLRSTLGLAFGPAVVAVQNIMVGSRLFGEQKH